MGDTVSGNGEHFIEMSDMDLMVWRIYCVEVTVRRLANMVAGRESIEEE